MSTLTTLFLYEIRMLLRDRRTMLIAVVAPVVLFPLFIVITNYVERSDQRRLDEATYTYAVTGTASEWATHTVEAALRIDPAPDDTTRVPVRFEERGPESADSLLEAGELSLVVVGLTAQEWRDVQEERRAEADSAQAAGMEPGPPVPALQLRYRARSDFSRRARERMREHLLALRERQRDSVFATAGFPVALDQVAAVEPENVASAARESGALLGVALTPFLLLLMLTGGSIVAADTIAGEKERGTLETLLTTAAGRSEIVRAKMLAIIAVGLAVAVINVINLLFYLVIGVLELPTSLQVSLGALDLGLLLLLFVPITVLLASALLLVSGVSKSYKEFQIYFLPVFLVLLVPTLAGALPGIELASAIALVPLAGISVAVREIMVGTVNLPWVVVAFASTGAAAWFLARRTEDALSTERLISPSELDEADLVGGPALFPRHVLRWFLGLWVLFFVVSLWFGEDLGLRGQVLVNLVVIFFGGSLVMIRRYRLDVRETFALRAPHPAAWAAVLVGAPSALILSGGLAELVNTYLFPVPRQMIEAFGESLVDPDIPLWQMILFLTVMPGVFEELTFRGALLHGLSKRLRPWALALAVGAVFGLFHVSLFRIVPTGFLGVVLAAVVLLTGSIYPAMLWHFLNNLVALVPARLGWVPDDFQVGIGLTALATVGVVVSFGILWRTRRGYPGLRGSGVGYRT